MIIPFFNCRALQIEAISIQEQFNDLEEQMNWMIINGRFSQLDANTRYQPILERLENDIESKQTEIDELQQGMKLEISFGVASLDQTLKERM